MHACADTSAEHVSLAAWLLLRVSSTALQTAYVVTNISGCTAYC